MKLGTVILAGGEGQRIRGNKPARMLAGKSLMRHVFDRVADAGTPIAFAIARGNQAPSFPWSPVLRDEANLGPIAGIGSALRWAVQQGLDAVLTVPCDTPFLPADLALRLAGSLISPIQVAIASSGGRAHPSCGLWSSGSLEGLNEYLARGRSLMGLAEHLNVARVEWQFEHCDPFLNVNTLEDLAAAEQFLNQFGRADRLDQQRRR